MISQKKLFTCVAEKWYPNIDTETIFSGIDLNCFSNSKLITDMKIVDLIIIRRKEADEISNQKSEELRISKEEIKDKRYSSFRAI